MAKALARRSMRLTFRYGPDGVRLVRRAMRGSPAPPGERLDAPVPTGAIVLELRTAEGGVRFRTFLHNPMPQSLETIDGAGQLRRVDRVKPAGAFTAVTPLPSDRGWFAVVSAGPAVHLGQAGLGALGQPGRWRELVRVELDGGRDGRQ